MNGYANSEEGKHRFIPVEDPKILIPFLKERHPQSCFAYNQAVFSGNLKDNIKFYTLSTKINSKSWFVGIYTSEDYGQNIVISAPNSIIREKEPIPAEVKQCFVSGPHSPINWNEGVVFIALEKPISAMIFDVSANIEENFTEVHPCILYYIENKDALNISINPGPEVEVKPLEPEKDTEFILSTWAYSKKTSRTPIARLLGATQSSGVFVDGKCVSGVLTQGYGLLSMLYTHKEYRGKGYGKLTMQYAYKESAKEGLVPCSTVEIKNARSIAFHESLGLKRSSKVDFICVHKLHID